MKKELGKIQRAEFGFGGYQDAAIGISFTLGGTAWGVQDFWRARSDHFVDKLAELLDAAKAQNVSKLVGVPVEVEFDGNVLKSWRVLTEVL